MHISHISLQITMMKKKQFIEFIDLILEIKHQHTYMNKKPTKNCVS